MAVTPGSWDLHPDRALPADPATRTIARRILDTTEHLPIVSMHGHVEADLLADDLPFPDPSALLVTPDHYLVRMLVSQATSPGAVRDAGVRTVADLGVAGPGAETDPRVIWRRFCAGWPVLRGTPTRLWLEHVLAEVFEAPGPPSPETADDLAAFEQRKLLLLNGGHLLLAFLGLRRGHETIADAVADPACRRALDRFWDEAARTVGDDVDPGAYRAALLARFGNPRIAHRLDQIAVDTVTKMRLRVLPVIRAERAAGRDAGGALAIIAAWRDAIDAGVLPDGAATRGSSAAVASLVAQLSGADADVVGAAASGVVAGAK